MPVYEYDEDYAFTAFATNLGKYNEGELVDEMPYHCRGNEKGVCRFEIGQKDDFGQYGS